MSDVNVFSEMRRSINIYKHTFVVKTCARTCATCGKIIDREEKAVIVDGECLCIVCLKCTDIVYPRMNGK